MSSNNKKSFVPNVTLSFIVIVVISFFVYDFFQAKNHNVIIENKSEVVTPGAVKDPLKGLVLIGRAESSFAGGTKGRQKNIELGIAKISGKVIAPGEEFSFKDTLGTTTLEMGYSEEKTFLNGEVTKSIGGGLCQVSTLIFRTAIATGLPITERANHSFTVSYYDVGLDATYSAPGPDIKFKNDTGNPIIIKGKTENEKAIFEIYGVSDGRVASTTEAEITDIKNILPTRYVYIPEPEKDQHECINTPQIGYTAKVKYQVLYPNGEYKNTEFVSNYKPLQRICYIIGDEIKTFDINKVLQK